ncbi:hypothetical protein BG011_002580 [Mortierella polycephala]|uniref:GTP-binding protein 8 n=1 Tax=Mortierella polycephala TaxID=41804 RepID=A0A9P6Q511_9FUNG|nr:hypothetical protein BG011_002580 [Mortierella polycephala]
MATTIAGATLRKAVQTCGVTMHGTFRPMTMRLKCTPLREIRTRPISRPRRGATDRIAVSQPKEVATTPSILSSPKSIPLASEVPVSETLALQNEASLDTAPQKKSQSRPHITTQEKHSQSKSATSPSLKSGDTKTEKMPKKLQAFPFIPGATSSELAKAHKFFFTPAEFVKSATSLHMIPDNTIIPEVAFIGRSNIGKSSLINGLVNRNGLVKTSSKPGHTRMMNFFKIGDRLSLVDMPGYGWKSRDEWGGMILSYLQNRKNLRRIYILVDPSHGLKESDTQIMKLLDNSGLSYQVVLTKIDRLSKTKYQAAKAAVEAELVKDAICCYPLILGVSSKTKDGLDDLRATIIKAGQLTL